MAFGKVILLKSFAKYPMRQIRSNIFELVVRCHICQVSIFLDHKMQKFPFQICKETIVRCYV